ncbi:MAG TPA: hypothetical protein VHW09_24030 [Bryobacteraceae bacterium]|nr:hypothetical protein [Bryobacteraceae bacterium]
MRWRALAALLLSGTVHFAPAADLKPATVAAFDSYIGQTQQRLKDRKTFLWADESADRRKRVRDGEIVVQPSRGQAITEVTDGLIHDWIGSVFVPGVSLATTLEHVQDYGNARTQHREVMASHIVEHHDDEYLVFMRLMKKKMMTVVLDTEHQIHYDRIDATHCRSESHTVKIAEVESVGKRDEHELPPGTGHGFLWKLNTFWRFEQRDGGTWMECQAISLTRDIPTGLGWLIEPIIRSLPQESLENTLRETAAALGKK